MRSLRCHCKGKGAPWVSEMLPKGRAGEVGECGMRRELESHFLSLLAERCCTCIRCQRAIPLGSSHLQRYGEMPE